MHWGSTTASGPGSSQACQAKHHQPGNWRGGVCRHNLRSRGHMGNEPAYFHSRLLGLEIHRRHHLPQKETGWTNVRPRSATSRRKAVDQIHELGEVCHLAEALTWALVPHQFL